jgi:phosphopantetheinyl transferase
MALFNHTHFLNRFELLIWKIENPEKLEINNIASSIAKKIDSNKSILKKNQILAVHQILKFKGFCSDDLIYNKAGAPFLKNGLKISISHSGLFVAVCLSKEKMGIDLQIVNKKILKVVDKFTNQIEKKLIDENNLEKLTQLWTIKEAAYKYFSLGNLSFKSDILVSELGDESQLKINVSDQVLNLKSKSKITSNYICSIVY